MSTVYTTYGTNSSSARVNFDRKENKYTVSEYESVVFITDETNAVEVLGDPLVRLTSTVIHNEKSLMVHFVLAKHDTTLNTPVINVGLDDSEDQWIGAFFSKPLNLRSFFSLFSNEREYRVNLMDNLLLAKHGATPQVNRVLSIGEFLATIADVSTDPIEWPVMVSAFNEYICKLKDNSCVKDLSDDGRAAWYAISNILVRLGIVEQVCKNLPKGTYRGYAFTKYGKALIDYFNVKYKYC